MKKLTIQPKKTTLAPHLLPTQIEEENKNKHISFSELKKWVSCPFARKLAYGDRIRLFNGNTYTAFGNALHETLEILYQESEPEKQIEDIFSEKLENHFSSLDAADLNLILAAEMPQQGLKIIKNVAAEVQKYFGEFKVVSLEEKLYCPITEISEEYNFKGFIDIVIQTSDNNYHIIDWKSCSWGWDARRRQDPMSVYQLTYYKKFFSEKHDIPLENIKTYFALLKRTTTKDNVEIFEVSNKVRRTQNALDLLVRALANINNGLCIKNRLSCRGCEFYKTTHCP